VRHLRIKESDRLAAMAGELGRAGVPVRELEDGLVIPGCWFEEEPPRDPIVVDSHDDHRIAMALALVGLRRPGLAIADPEVVAKSYPNFWRDLSTLLS
jgi:3-phosphoshikimate 1-carboxyvinyltransferase